MVYKMTKRTSQVILYKIFRFQLVKSTLILEMF